MKIHLVELRIRRTSGAQRKGACLVAFIATLCGCDLGLWHDKDLRALIDDFDRYDRCYEAQFKPSECERWRVNAAENPEYWPYPAVPALKWPEAPKERVYKRGMNREQYFDALCAAEAGEFMSRKVEGVEGIYMIRPRKHESGPTQRDRYAKEDPYGSIQGDAGDDVPYMFLGRIEYAAEGGTPSYRYIETPALPVDVHRSLRDTYHPGLFEPVSPDRPYRVYRWEENAPSSRLHNGAVTYASKPSSRFGYTWRGIRRPYDREFGIAGGELAVVDLTTNEILGLRRGFALAHKHSWGQIDWGIVRLCPRYSQMPGLGQYRKRDADGDYTRWFLTKVVTPPNRLVSKEEYGRIVRRQ